MRLFTRADVDARGYRVMLLLACGDDQRRGQLFRVSSIDADTQGAYREQDRFVNDLLVAMSVQDRGRMIGLASPL